MRHSYELSSREWRLRPVALEDAAFIVRLRNQGHVVGKINDSVVDVESQRRWLVDYLDRAGDYYWILETPLGEAFGTVSLYHYDSVENKIECGRWVQLKDDRFVYNVFDLLLKVYAFAFDELKVDKLVFDVKSDNARVLRFHRLIGARETGVEKGLFVIQGKSADMIWFEITRELWPTVRENLRALS